MSYQGPKELITKSIDVLNARVFHRDFASNRTLNPVGPNDPQITFNRSTTATRVNESGLIESVAIDTPRFDFDPVTLQCKGLLIEESRQNLCLRSEEFNDAIWGKGNATVSTNTAISPDGTLDADSLIVNTSNTAHLLVQTFSIISGTTYTLSCFAKANQYSVFGLVFTATGFGTNTFANFDLLNGICNVSGAAGATVAITSYGNGWYRCSLTLTATSTVSSSIQLRVIDQYVVGDRAYTGDGTSGIFIYGAQLEATAYPTSYIPTAGTAITRGADLARVIGSSFTSMYNRVEGSIFCSYTPPALGQYLQLAHVDDGTTINQRAPSLGHHTSNLARFDWFVNAVAQINVFQAGTLTLSRNNAACSYKIGEGASIGANGQTNSVGAAITPPTVNTFYIGARAGVTQVNGPIASISYYNKRLPDKLLQAITLP